MDTPMPAEARRVRPVPPTLRGVPVLGVLPELKRDPLAVFARARALGDVVRLAVPGRQAVFVLADPADIRHVLQENNANYRRTKFHDRLKSVLGDGLVTSDGDLWRRQRRLLQPAFRAERIRRFVAIMGRAAVECAGRWERAADDGAVLDAAAEMSDLTLDIVLRCMFGQEQRAGDVAIGAAVRELQEWVAARFWSLAPDWTERLPLPANRRFGQARAELDATLARIIQARLDLGEAGDDLLGMLLAAQGAEDDDGAPEARGGIAPRQVRDEAMTMLLAGHETSAVGLAWTWHLLGQHPEVADAVRDEAVSVLAGRDAPDADDLGRLGLVRAVVEESMRLYPPVGWFGRLAAGPDQVGGHAVLAGSVLVLSPWLMQHDRRHWPDPERFDPARFAPGARQAPYTYFPFGGGPRTCIGNHFAITEMVVTLAVLVARVRLHPASDAPVRAELMVTLRPADGLPMRVERRAAAIPREAVAAPG
jgi:cytochrome P450